MSPGLRPMSAVDDSRRSDLGRNEAIGSGGGRPSEAGDAGPVVLQRRQQLEQHLRSSPTDLDAYFELARIYRLEDRPLEARRILAQALQTFPDHQALLWELEEATLARSLQQYREVSEIARRLQTPEAERELQRSRSDWALRRIEVCRARLDRDPSLSHLRIVLAEAFIDAGRYEEAIEAVGPALEIDEQSCHGHLLVAKCLIAQGEDERALPHLRAASMRRAVVAPPRTKLAALRLLCDAAERLGLPETLPRYQQQRKLAEQQLAAGGGGPDDRVKES